MFNGSNCDRKSQLSGILTEPLNPRDIELVAPSPSAQEVFQAVQLILVIH